MTQAVMSPGGSIHESSAQSWTQFVSRVCRLSFFLSRWHFDWYSSISLGRYNWGWVGLDSCAQYRAVYHFIDRGPNYGWAGICCLTSDPFHCPGQLKIPPMMQWCCQGQTIGWYQRGNCQSSYNMFLGQVFGRCIIALFWRKAMPIHKLIERKSRVEFP